MIRHKYGAFSDRQMRDYKKKLHAKIYWLLLYKDPKVDLKGEEKSSEDFEAYFISIIREISGLNLLLKCPVEMVQLLSVLEYARHISTFDTLDFQVYRKLILDAQSLVNQIGGKHYDK